MQAANVEPQLSTYERIIRLCLLPAEYDDAFLHLEGMKERGIKPSEGIYRAILAKCLDFEDQRWRLVQEEMVEQGYGAAAQVAQRGRGAQRRIDGDRENRRARRRGVSEDGG
jgi:hypothetical protein